MNQAVRCAAAPRPVCARAFSLVELVTVIVIVGALSAVALPRYANSLSHYKADAAARQLIADLAHAASAARASSRPVNVVFQPGRNAYRVQGVTITLKNGGGESREFDKEVTGGTLVGANFASTATLTFDGFGKGSSDGTIVLRFGDNFRVISFNALSGTATFTRGGSRPSGGGGSGGSGTVDDILDGLGNVVGQLDSEKGVTINIGTGGVSLGGGK